MPIRVPPAMSAKRTTDEGRRSARPQTRGISTRLSNSSYADMATRTTTAITGPRAKAARTAGPTERTGPM